MRELVSCFINWLQAEPASNNAWKILLGLSQETLKRAESLDPEQREFDVAQLAQVCRQGENLDYEIAKKWFLDAKVPAFIAARKIHIEKFFRVHGHTQCLSLEKRSSSGRHKATWYLKIYELSESTENDQAIHNANGFQSSNQIEYSVTEPGTIPLSGVGKIVLGRGIFKTKSWRGGLWTISFLGFCLMLLLVMYLIFQMRTITRPMQTGDFVLLSLLCGSGWLIWRFQVRPFVWLLEDRIGFASNLYMKLSEEEAQFDLAKDGEHRYFRLVRYSGVCPICAGNVELRYGTGENHRRLFGCCTEVPTEHVFTFDRISRVGVRYFR